MSGAAARKTLIRGTSKEQAFQGRKSTAMGTNSERAQSGGGVPGSGRARTCGESTRGSSDREIRGGDAGGPALAPRAPPVGASSPLGARGGSLPASSPAVVSRAGGGVGERPVALAMCANGLFVRKASALASVLWEKTGNGTCLSVVSFLAFLSFPCFYWALFTRGCDVFFSVSCPGLPPYF
jgi:hypothetical protein